MAHLLRRLRLVQGAIPDSVAAATDLRLAEAAKRDIAGYVLIRALVNHGEQCEWIMMTHRIRKVTLNGKGAE